MCGNVLLQMVKTLQNVCNSVVAFEPLEKSSGFGSDFQENKRFDSVKKV